ncbi:elongation of very long chain fatty acids protein 7-like [Melitaea cinxia]|uniref:elongation of very long chain fatty acids protein 7-like n=1 Tax=Melitaea cinxia TaxID=113334 RepID=UPI001E271DC7|nr:elongation of very long chain fatty acids protein 7-like [Melitaea cinxia]
MRVAIDNAVTSWSVSTWSLGETSFGLAIVMVLYVITVLKILPHYMKNRNPYKLTRLLTYYNAFQVAFSAYAVFLYTRYIFNHGIITTRCPKGDELKGVIREIWPYFIAKHIDLLDTVFFVLRKKENQVTFLHILHHNLMVAWTWFHLMYHPTDHFVVVGLINSFVHVLMYAYYGLSSLGPEYAKFTWWKKHLTKIQLIQFILVLLNLHYQQKMSPCPIPSFFHYFCLSSISSFFFLFINFYIKSYESRSKKNTNTGNDVLGGIGCNFATEKED